MVFIILLFIVVTYVTGRTHQKLSNEPRYRSPFIGDLTRGTFLDSDAVVHGGQHVLYFSESCPDNRF